MPNGIDGSFCGGIDSRDMNIHRVITALRAPGKIPLRGTGGRSQARFGGPHNATIRAPGCDIAPTFARNFNEVPCTIIDDQAGGRQGWKTQWISGRIDFRAVIGKRGKSNP